MTMQRPLMTGIPYFFGLLRMFEKIVYFVQQFMLIAEGDHLPAWFKMFGKFIGKVGEKKPPAHRHFELTKMQMLFG